MKRCPAPFENGPAELEIRQIFEADDFGAEFTPEARAQEERMPRADRRAEEVIDGHPLQP